MKFLIIGAQGQVGLELCQLIAQKGYEYTALDRNNFDLTDQVIVQQTIQMHHDADVVINAAAYTAVDKAEDEAELCDQVNHIGVKYLAEACAQHDLPLFHISTDYVFSGDKVDAAYSETDATGPLGVYGQTKLAGDMALSQAWHKHIILRVSWVFGAQGQNFVKTILNLAKTRESLNIVADQWGCPTAAADIARVLIAIAEQLDLNSDRESRWGVYHYCNSPKTNWYQFAKTFIELAQAQRSELIALKNLNAITTEQYPTKAARPKNSELSPQKLLKSFDIQQRDWQDYLAEIIETL